MGDRMLLRMRRARLEAGLLLTEAGKRLRMTPQVLGRLELGRAVPWPSLRKRMSELYGIPEDKLFADIDANQEYLKKIAGKSKEEIEKLTDGP